MVFGFPILLLALGLFFCLEATNAAPLQQRGKQILPTRENVPNSEFGGFSIDSSGNPKENGGIQDPASVDTGGDDGVSPITTEGDLPRSTRTFGILPPADPDDPFSLSVTGTADETFTTTAISTTSVDAPPSDDIHPTPSQAPPFENDPPTSSEGSGEFEQPQPTPAQTSAASDPPPINDGTQPPPTDSSADQVLTQSPAEPTAVVPPINPGLTQVASYSQTLQPTSTFILYGVPTPSAVVGEGTVKGTVPTNLAYAPTGIVSGKPTSTVPVVVKPQKKKEQAASTVLSFINTIGQMLSRLNNGEK